MDPSLRIMRRFGCMPTVSSTHSRADIHVSYIPTVTIGATIMDRYYRHRSIGRPGLLVWFIRRKPGQEPFAPKILTQPIKTVVIATYLLWRDANIKICPVSQLIIRSGWLRNYQATAESYKSRLFVSNYRQVKPGLRIARPKLRSMLGPYVRANFNRTAGPKLVG